MEVFCNPLYGHLMGHWSGGRRLLVCCLGQLLITAFQAGGVMAEDALVLPDHAVLRPDSLAPRRHVALGVNYTGGQLRYRFRSPWAVELRYQQGTASSDYGDVKSQVVGLRGYHFYKRDRPLAYYLGTEIAHVEAKPEASNYRASGFAAGAFGGMEFRVTKNIGLGIDIGPYMISMEEVQTHISQTNLDFILNTGLLWYVF